MKAATGTALAFCALLAATRATAAEAPQFRLPLDCEIGETCYIQKYVDHDTGAGYADYRCGPLSNDGHRGTDIRLLDFAAMAPGVAVLAAAAGVVAATRDGMPDVSSRLVGKDAVTDRGRGNFVAIDHGGGWRTIYAHMRRGSVAVRTGGKVDAGARLGLVGLSGLTNFPHVHFAVERNGRVVDPFVGAKMRIGCGPASGSMWRPKLQRRLIYRPTFSMRAGFSNRPMTLAALQYGLYDSARLSRKRGQLFFGIFVAGLYKGDTYRFRLKNAKGRILRELNRVETRRRTTEFLKARLSRIHLLPPGRYTAQFTLSGIRDGRRGVVLEESRTLDLGK